MDSFSNPFRRPPAFGRPCIGYTDSRSGQVSHQTGIRRHRHLLVAGGQPRGKGGAPGFPNAKGLRCVVAAELGADDLPRDAIELAAARDALLIG